MIKLSDLKASLSSTETLTSVYLTSNTLATVPGKDVVFEGPSAIVIDNVAGLKITSQNPQLGYVWTSSDAYGTGFWNLSSSSLFGAYKENNQITTVDAYGNVTIAGTEALEVSATEGVITSLIQTSGANDLLIKTPNNLSIHGNTTVVDGYVLSLPSTTYPPAPGKVWTAENSNGDGYWQSPVSDLQGAYQTNNTITTTALEGDLTIAGTEQLVVSTDAYFSGSVRIQATTPIAGKVWTALNTNGDGSWEVPVSDLQGAYLTNNTITTSAGEGNIIFTGTEALDLEISLNALGDAYFSGLVTLASGNPAPGSIFTSSNLAGDGYWNAIPDAYLTNSGFVSSEFSSGELTIPTTLTWEGGNSPTGLEYKLYRWVKVGKRVDVWFNSKYTTSNVNPASSVTFSLPIDCPTPELWTGMLADEVVAFGNGKTFVSALGTESVDHTSKVALYHNAGSYLVSVVTYSRVYNAYGAFSAQALSPIGFNAHITYFTTS